jgi:hypothetical protein
MKFTSTGKYVEFIRKDAISNAELGLDVKTYSAENIYDLQAPKIQILNNEFYKPTFDPILNHESLAALKKQIKNASEKELVEGNLYQIVKNTIDNIINTLGRTPEGKKFIKGKLADSWGRIEIGDDIYSTYVERALMEIRAKYIVNSFNSIDFTAPRITTRVFKLNEINIKLSVDNQKAISAGLKVSTLRSDKQAKEIGLNKGDKAFTEINGKSFQVTYHGLYSVSELGGAELVANMEGLPTSETNTNKIPVTIAGITYYVKFQQTANFLKGQGGLHYYSFLPVKRDMFSGTEDINNDDVDNLPDDCKNI